MSDKFFSVAIDGPSGAGKSSLAKSVAERFGFIYADTGAIYRTLGLAVKRAGIGSKDAAGVSALLPSVEIELRHDSEGRQRMLLSGEDVSDAIRTPEMSIYASDVSAIPEVRAFLMEMQRDLARKHNLIMDGRDIGTAVLPDADLKIFLVASSEARAMRRLRQLADQGIDTTFEAVLTDIEYRDKNDSSRAAAPLKPADDSVHVDNTQNTFEQSRDLISSLILERYRP